MVEFIKYRIIRLGMLMIKRSLSRLFRFVRIVVRFYLNPKKDEMSFWIEFIFLD